MRIRTKVAPEEMKKKERIQEIFKGTHCSSPQITDRMQMKKKKKETRITKTLAQGNKNPVVKREIISQQVLVFGTQSQTKEPDTQTLKRLVRAGQEN